MKEHADAMVKVTMLPLDDGACADGKARINRVSVVVTRQPFPKVGDKVTWLGRPWIVTKATKTRGQVVMPATGRRATEPDKGPARGPDGTRASK